MNLKSPKVIYADVDTDHTYQEVWDLQKHLQAKVIDAKRNGNSHVPGYLLLCEHAPVYTIGKSGKMEHLRIPLGELENQNTEFFKINRGGDITYHGPGQVTAYPILDLDQYYNDVHRYVRDLEEVIIRVINGYGLKGERVEGLTGVWIIDEEGKRKIAAIGVHMSRWVSMHGFALNVSNDLDYYNQIIPCGIKEPDTSVTSISYELGQEINIKEVKSIIKAKLAEVFGYSYLNDD